MAQLLGQVGRIESLRQDLGDLQSVITDAISHVGKIRCTSWRNPDKIACDIDISSLLETYRYTINNDQSNQLAHVVLIETVVDRLVLMLQLMNKFLDRIKLDETSASANQGRSIGIVAKRYWLRLLRLVTYLQQQNSKPSPRNRLRGSILEETLSKNKISNILKFEYGVNESNNVGANQTYTVNSNKDIAREDSNKATQTAETSLAPCDSCYQSQHGLKSIADLINDIFKVLKFNKATVKLNKAKDARMSASEINTVVQMTTSNLKHMQDEALKIASSVEPLKSQLLQYEDKFKELEKIGERLAKEGAKKEAQWNKEREKHEKDFEIYRKSFKIIEERAKESESSFNLKLESSDMEIRKLKSELDNQADKYYTLCKSLSDKDQIIKSEKEKFKLIEVERNKLLETIRDLELHKEEALTNLNKFMDLLKMEQKRVQQDEEYNQELLEKHKHMVQDLKKLDQENDQLQIKIAKLVESEKELEVENEKYRHIIDKLSQAIEQYMKKMDLHNLSQDALFAPTESIATADAAVTMDANEFLNVHALPKKFNLYTDLIQKKLEELRRKSEGSETMKTRVEKLQEELRELREQQMLLVNYPDLNLRPVSETLGTEDNVSVDMAKQIEANKIRINVLQNENLRLSKSVHKLQSLGQFKVDSKHTLHPSPILPHPSPILRPQPPQYDQQHIGYIINHDIEHPSPTATKKMNRYHSVGPKRVTHTLEHSVSEKDLFAYGALDSNFEPINQRDRLHHHPPIRKQYFDGALAIGDAKTNHKSPRRNSTNGVSPQHAYAPHPPGRAQQVVNMEKAFNQVDVSFVVGKRPNSGGGVMNRRETRKVVSAKK